MGLILSSVGMPAGTLKDVNALFGLDVVCDLFVVVSHSVSTSLLSVSPS